jgi:non-heme chloroperoxidase
MAMLAVGSEEDARVTARLLPDLNTNVTVVEIDGAPHGLAWTHPAEINQAILAFLEN